LHPTMKSFGAMPCSFKAKIRAWEKAVFRIKATHLPIDLRCFDGHWLGRPGSSWSRRRCRPRTDLADGHWDFGGPWFVDTSIDSLDINSYKFAKICHIVFPKCCWFFDICWSLLSHACRGCLTAIATVCDSKGIRC
jgi:hypothetical protein